MIKYEFFDSGKLLIVKFIGTITKHDLISFFKFILKKGYLSSLKEILADYRDAIKIYEVADLDEIAKERKKVTEGLDEINTIFLVGNPEDTAISFLFAEYYKGYSHVKICSTVAASSNYLSMKVTSHNLKNMLANLKLEYAE